MVLFYAYWHCFLLPLVPTIHVSKQWIELKIIYPFSLCYQANNKFSIPNTLNGAHLVLILLRKSQ